MLPIRAGLVWCLEGRTSFGRIQARKRDAGSMGTYVLGCGPAANTLVWAGSQEGAGTPFFCARRNGGRFSMDRCRWRGKSSGPASGRHEGRDTPLMSMGAGRVKSPASGEPAIRFYGAARLNAECWATARGMQRGCAAAPLPRFAVLHRTSCTLPNCPLPDFSDFP